jgi:proteic killer suppression protein
MQVKFAKDYLKRLETDAAFTAGFSVDIVRAYRKCMQLIRASTDERDLYAFKSRRFERLKGGRSSQHSLRLNDQWRLIVEIEPSRPKNILVIAAIEDYH